MTAIKGIGVDLVEITRLENALQRAPSLRDRLFAESERSLPPRSLAARFAAREALIKALGGDHDLHWHDLEVVTEASGAPRFAMHEALERALASVGASAAHVTMTHDAGMACAFVVLE